MMLGKSGLKEILMPVVESMVSMGLLSGVIGVQSGPNDACILVRFSSRLHGSAQSIWVKRLVSRIDG